MCEECSWKPAVIDSIQCEQVKHSWGEERAFGYRRIHSLAWEHKGTDKLPTHTCTPRRNSNHPASQLPQPHTQTLRHMLLYHYPTSAFARYLDSDWQRFSLLGQVDQSNVYECVYSLSISGYRIWCRRSPKGKVWKQAGGWVKEGASVKTLSKINTSEGGKCQHSLFSFKRFVQ